MDDLLHGLVCDLHRRCENIKETLSQGQFKSPVDSYALKLYMRVEERRREVERLLMDPALGSPPLIKNHFQEHKRLAEDVWTIEAGPLPVVLRFTDDDFYLTSLCGRVIEQAAIPVDKPLVVTFSNDYYWTQADYNLIFAPTLEAHSLLGLPDLYHEIAHLIIARYSTEFIDPFLSELRSYIAQEKRRILLGQRPKDPADYDLLLFQWEDRWVIEFVADMIATYLVGEAYGWQHLRLCSRMSEALFVPSFGEFASHPADDARIKGIVTLLKGLSSHAMAQSVADRWRDYITNAGEAPVSPGDYSLCYPDHLISFLEANTRLTCQRLGIRSIAECSDPKKEDVNVGGVIKEAWERFFGDALTYPIWEQQQVKLLRAEFLC